MARIQLVINRYSNEHCSCCSQKLPASPKLVKSFSFPSGHDSKLLENSSSLSEQESSRRKPSELSSRSVPHELATESKVSKDLTLEKKLESSRCAPNEWSPVYELAAEDRPVVRSVELDSSELKAPTRTNSFKKFLRKISHRRAKALSSTPTVASQHSPKMNQPEKIMDATAKILPFELPSERPTNLNTTMLTDAQDPEMAIPLHAGDTVDTVNSSHGLKHYTSEDQISVDEFSNTGISRSSTEISRSSDATDFTSPTTLFETNGYLISPYETGISSWPEDFVDPMPEELRLSSDQKSVWQSESLNSDRAGVFLQQHNVTSNNNASSELYHGPHHQIEEWLQPLLFPGQERGLMGPLVDINPSQHGATLMMSRQPMDSKEILLQAQLVKTADIADEPKLDIHHQASSFTEPDSNAFHQQRSVSRILYLCV